MTDLLSDVDAPSDAELISRVRGGDVAAYGDLFSRHKDAANRLARQLVRGPDSDDLVAEAFAKVLTVLQGGGGPDVAFRAYLLTAVRRLHVDRVRVGQRLQTTDDMTPFDPGVPFQDTAVAGFESGAAAKAFASLPERWQLVLWHLEVEGQKPADIAPLLGMSANSVSALAYRAREGLRQAFLTMHLSDISETDCRWVNEHLGAFVRKGLSKRDSGKVQGHLDECRRCTAMYLELTDVNSNLAGIIAPLLLGAAATGYLASSGAGLGGLLGLVSRAKDFAAANTGAVAAGAVATGVVVAAVATVVVTQLGGPEKNVTADPAAGITSSAPAASGSDGPSSRRSASASASPSASAPTSTVSASPSASASLSASESASASASASASESPGLALLPTDLPTDGVTDGVTDAPTDGPTDGPTGNPTGNPTGGPTDTPTDPPTTEPPAPGQPAVSALTVNDDGSVDVGVTNVSTGDVVDVAMAADQTTFGTPPSGCTGGGTAVSCLPFSQGAGRFAGEAPGDYAVTLPLEFPGSMVDDDLTITVSVNGTQLGDQAQRSFHPSRTPSFDFALGTLEETGHTLAGDVDRYDVTTTARLPHRVHGLRYHLGAAATFREVDGDGCTPSDDGAILTCPDVADGDTVVLPLAAESLTATATPQLRVEPVVTFDDPTPGNDGAPVTLAPGADLSLPDLTVFSANPDRNGLVTLQGTLAGARAGMAGVSYELVGAATFPDGRNPGCTPSTSGTVLSCPDAGNGAIDLVIRPVDRHAVTEVSIGAYPRPPFVSVGSGHTASLTLPGRPTHDFSLAGLTVTAHTVAGETDTYQVAGTVGALPSDVDTLDLAVTGATIAAQQADDRCRPMTVDGADLVRCTGLRSDPDLSLTLTSSQAVSHAVTVTALPADPYDDPEPDPTPDADTVTVAPGTNLTLTTPAGALSRGAGGTYAVPVTLGGVRADLPAVVLTLGGGATFAEDQPDCTRVSGTRLRCADPVDGGLTLPVVADDAAHATDLTVTATPGGDFEQLGGDNVARPALRATYDFSLGALTRTGQTVSGGTDRYTLHTTVGDRPSGVDPLTLAVTGARFASTQPDCAYVDATHVRCGSGATDLAVLSTTTASHVVTLTQQTPAGYDDPTAGNDTRSITLQPGVDLALADLDPDNESPANDDASHLVSTRLDGTRAGLGRVTYTLTGDATFVGADAKGCTPSGKTVVCTDPVDGPVTFTVKADDVHQATDIRIAVAAPDAFLELDTSDNSDRVRLLPRPTHDFSMGPLRAGAHTVTGGTDHYTLTSQVGAVPAGVDGLTFALTGGTFADGQGAGCSRTDATHVSCGDLGTARDVDLRVDSTSDDAHDLGVSLQVPRGYDDTDASNDSRSVAVTPGIDLALGALTPANPVPAGNGTYVVTTTLTGVRSGAVRLAVDGAEVTASSCSVTSAALVTCAAPTEGQQVSLTLRPAKATGATPVTVTATGADRYTELAPGDNDATTTLAPDLTVGSLTVRDDRSPVATVRVQVSGSPRGMSSMRIRLGGTDAGLGTNQVHFTGGAEGADGEGIVTCYTSDADGKKASNGLYATCSGMQNDTNGSFYIDVRLSHQHGRTSNVTLDLVPLGVDEGTHGGNNSSSLTLH